MSIYGINLPDHYCRDDEKWIIEQMSKLPTKVRAKISALYSDVYVTAYNNESINHKKENRARREANTRLREYVERYTSVMNQAVSKPPIVTL
ncbi:hypothetical protein [Gilliamella sp. N-G2]|uniref:hypothetical protein n=1 Tax=Gilliamella sp. N-G2 TaxID=1970471 RepID=UPI000A335270|nr:hypothetical protein [Gilliamella sp. N-G2]OTQ71865.1 hypothetical protein B6C99_11695 [Gilliamella sp. N-G2]